jgi:hypothetical protein
MMMEPFNCDIETLIKLCRPNGVSMLGIYGSTARGEATKQISEKIRSGYSDIPWKDMAGTGDKLIRIT